MASVNGSKTLMLLVGAIGFGIAAAILSVVYLKSRERAIIESLRGEDEEMVQVVVAKQDLQKGQKLSPGLFAVRNVPSTYVHPNAITPGMIDEYYGRFIVEDITRGKPLLVNFIDVKFPVDFSDLVEQGRRAITVQVDEVQSIAGLIRPGNRIDVYVNIGVKIAGFTSGNRAVGIPNYLQQVAAGGNLPEGIGEAAGSLIQSPSDVVIPVLQDVTVLATGRETYDENLDALRYPQQRTGFNFTTMTLDVSPEQAALLAIAEDKGDLIAVLRNRDDRGKAEFEGITPFDLIRHAREMKKQEAMRQAAEAAGATIDENGNWVTADGTVIRKEDIQVSASGVVTTRDGNVLASGVSKDEMMKAAGYTVNENGDYVDKDGNVIARDDVKVLANGTVMTSDGKVVSGENVTVNDQGFIVAEDGTVMTADGKILSGVSVNENGEVVGPDGRVMTDPNLVVAADGTVRDSDGNIIAGITGSNVPADFVDPAPGLTDEELADLPLFISLIIGGSSKDGVATTNVLLVQPLKQQPVETQ